MVFIRDDFICQECKIIGNIQAHHKKRFGTLLYKYNIKTVEEALKCGELWDIDNGITYCINCHKIKHKKVNENGKSKEEVKH